MRHKTVLALLLSFALIAAACADDDDEAADDEVAEDDGGDGGDDAAGSEVPSSAPLQGVTDNEIKVGIVHFPLNNNDMSTHWEAAFKQAREDGRLPVHGRDIKPVYHLLDSSSAQASAESHRAACLKFADEEKVFMGLGVSNFRAVADCMTGEKQLVFVGSAGSIPNDEVLAQNAPFLFVNNMSPSKLLRNWPHWAEDNGFLEGKKLGLVRADDPTIQAELDGNFKPELEDLGYEITEEALYTDPASVPGIVQRLKASGVEVVFLDAVASFIPFAQELEAQDYHPQVLGTDHDSTSLSASIPRDGTPPSFRMTTMTAYQRARDGIEGNPPGPTEQKACIDNYAKHYGQTFVEYSGGRPTADYSNFHSIQHVCDIVNYLLDVLEKIGPDLTPTALVHGLETEVKGVPSGEVLDITFGKDDHSGSEQLKTIEWNPACLCWSHTSDPRDVYVK